MNVLLVTFDTTRADRLGPYGNDTIQTPTLDRLAAEGVRFANAFATVPITAPSHSSIMTGRYPLAHGVRDNGLFVLGEAQTTLADVLGEHGWATGAAIGAFPLDSQFGVGQGFDFYDDDVATTFDPLDLPAGANRGIFFDERRAGRVNDAILPWLESNASGPFFAWVHYFDPHQPLEPPPPYDQLYLDDPYDGEIAYADESLGTIIRNLERLGVADRTLIVMTADHGEGIGEHRETTHSLLAYNATLHVPLIVRMPGGRAGATVETRVSSVDIAPTVLELVGVDVPDEMQGQSLAAVIRPDGNSVPAKPIYSETLSPRLGYGWGELRALFAGNHKYIHGPRPELFDLENDPKELDNLVERDPETTDRMRRGLEEFITDHTVANDAAASEVSDETRRRLMALGYLAGDASGAAEIVERLRSDGTPPQDRVVDVNNLSRAKQLIFSEAFLDARAAVEQLLATDPDNPAYLELLATAQLGLGRIDDAVATLERSTKIASPSQSARRLLLRVALATSGQGDHDRALELVDIAQRDAEEAAASYIRGQLLQELGRDPEGVAAIEHALDLDPSYAPARVELAIALDRAGRSDEAEAAFLRALQDDPYYPKAHFNHGVFLLESDRVDEAIAAFERAVAVEATYLQAHHALVVMYARTGAPDQARAAYSRLARIAPRSTEATEAAGVIEALQ